MMNHFVLIFASGKMITIIGKVNKKVKSTLRVQLLFQYSVGKHVCTCVRVCVLQTHLQMLIAI